MSSRATPIPLTTSEKLHTWIEAEADPTSDVVAFAFTIGVGRTPPATGSADWKTGAFVSGSFNTKTSEAQAKTANVGKTGGSPAPVHVVTEGVWRLWGRVTTASEAPVFDLGLADFFED